MADIVLKTLYKTDISSLLLILIFKCFALKCKDLRIYYNGSEEADTNANNQESIL